jgi:hypothetical protein
MHLNLNVYSQILLSMRPSAYQLRTVLEVASLFSCSVLKMETVLESLLRRYGNQTAQAQKQIVPLLKAHY